MSRRRRVKVDFDSMPPYTRPEAYRQREVDRAAMRYVGGDYDYDYDDPMQWDWIDMPFW